MSSAGSDASCPEDQDRSLWNRDQIAEGKALLERAIKSVAAPDRGGNRLLGALQYIEDVAVAIFGTVKDVDFLDGLDRKIPDG